MLTEQTPDEVSAAPDHEPTEQAGAHHFRLNEAAQSCGVSRSTMRRKRESGAFPNAYTDSAGAWIIPLADLLAAGLTPGKSRPEHAAQTETATTTEQAQNRRFEQPDQAVTITLDEWQELIEARTERNGLRDQLQRADEAKDEAVKSAWAWHEQAQLMQRQLLPAAAPVVDVRDPQPSPGKRRGLFR